MTLVVSLLSIVSSTYVLANVSDEAVVSSKTMFETQQFAEHSLSKNVPTYTRGSVEGTDSCRFYFSIACTINHELPNEIRTARIVFIQGESLYTSHRIYNLQEFAALLKTSSIAPYGYSQIIPFVTCGQGPLIPGWAVLSNGTRVPGVYCVSCSTFVVGIVIG